MTGAVGRAGARTQAGARRAMRMVISPIEKLLNGRKHDAAITIAGAVMMRVAYLRILKLKEERRKKAAIRIQRYLRDRHRNSVISRRRDLFRGVCAQAMYRMTAKGKASVVICAVGRGYVARRRLVQARQCVIRVQALTRGWLGRRKAQSRRTYAQHLGEEEEAGRVRWEQLARRREEEELVSGARSEDLDDDLELHRTFMKYCRFGDRQNTGRMVVTKLTALCKDSGIIDKRFPAQRVEISFSRLKPKGLSHLPYSSFLAALDDISIQHPDVPKLAEAAADKALDERASTFTKAPHDVSTAPSWAAAHCGGGPGTYSGSHSVAGIHTTNRSGSPSMKRGPLTTSFTSTESAAADGRVSEEESARILKVERGEAKLAKLRGRSGVPGTNITSVGGATSGAASATGTAAAAVGEKVEVWSTNGFRPVDQRLLVLLQKYVLVKSQSGKEACSELEAEGRGARQRALIRLQAAAVIVQARMARGCAGRKIAREASERRELKRYRAKINLAATLLQARMRGFAARTRVSKMAANRFYRCLDDLTGAEYYFDPKTGKAWWKKPKILGKFDIPTLVVVPAGEEIMVPMCHECAKEVATEICIDCDEDMLCQLCVDQLHRTGRAATHTRVRIDMCEECSFQVAVKHCQQCGDDFCVSCFAFLHRKGRLRRHTFDPIFAMCDDCGNRTQALQCSGCEPEGQLLLCRPCLEARHHVLLPHELADHRIEAVGLRSMRVKRMRDEKAERAKERWMKAALPKANKRREAKNMLAAAIKIQAVWRGYLARKRLKLSVGEHLLWRLQRLKDDEIRRKTTYKIALFLGKARLLKSDTNREIVLKQYPRWWQSTIIDIVRPTIGWHEGVKMVREQEFFAKKTKRKGRWRVPVARMRLCWALLRLQLAKRRQRECERLHATAVEAYQHARAKGGVSAEHKEELQQRSRRAKRAVKKREEERAEVEAMVTAAENALEALIGPFRLRKAVRGALTKGILMPFPVSVQTGKATARLKRGQNMREVRNWIPFGRRIRVEPAERSYEPPGVEVVAVARRRLPSHAFGPFLVLGVKESKQNERKDKAEAVASYATAAFTGVRMLEDIGRNNGRPSAGSSNGATATLVAVSEEGADPDGGVTGAGEGEQAAAAAAAGVQSSVVLVLDRQWVLAEASPCRAYAMPFLPPLQNVLMTMRTGMSDGPIVQAALKVVICAARTHSHRLKRWQEKFDDDSPMCARLERWAVGSEVLSERLILRRCRLFDAEKGYDEQRKKVAEAVDYVREMWASLLAMADFAKSAAATGLVSKEACEGGGIIGGTLGHEVVAQLFKKWVRSDKRTKVIIMHRSGKTAKEPTAEVVQVVGYIKVDLDTPTPIVREFIRRFCGGWLNAHAKGDRFSLENSNGKVIRRSREGGKSKATAMDMIQRRVNKSTRDTEEVIFVRDERNRTDPDAEVEPVLVPEKDLLDPESTTTFDNEIGGEGNGAPRKYLSKDGEEGVAEKGGESDMDGSSSDFSSEHSSDSFGSSEHSSDSFGSTLSDMNEPEEDPFEAMEKDLQAKQDEENLKAGNHTSNVKK